MNDATGVGIDDALDVIRDLAEEFYATTRLPLRSIVTIGGTALAAHAIRDRSEDIDVYLSDVEDDILDRVKKRHEKRFGSRFKIDATPSNTLWGAIALADIEDSPIVRQIDTSHGRLDVRALSVETLYIVKTAANRDKDQPDISALASRTTYDRTIARARVLFSWYADRSAFPEHAERLARYIARDHGVPLVEVDRDFGLPAVTAAKVLDVRKGMEAQFLHSLKAMMTKHPNLISFDTAMPMRLGFNARTAGAGDEILAIVSTKPTLVSDMAAVVLKERDPRRHVQRLKAVNDLAKRPDPGMMMDGSENP